MEPPVRDQRVLFRMTADDFRFHEKLLRLLKGALRAYEEWIEAKKQKTETAS